MEGIGAENDDKEFGRSVREDVFIVADLPVQECVGKGLGVQREGTAGGEYDAGVTIGEEAEITGGFGFLIQEEVVFDKPG